MGRTEEPGPHEAVVVNGDTENKPSTRVMAQYVVGIADEILHSLVRASVTK
jgi:ribosome-associated protein YbcJ (S4-like RNA binding protein)